MDESNYEILNRKNRIYIRRFRHDPTRFERSQQRVHRRGGYWGLLIYYMSWPWAVSHLRRTSQFIYMY